MQLVKNYVKRHLDPGTRLYETLRLTYGLATLQRPVIKKIRRRLFRDGIFHDEDELYMCSLLPADVLTRVIERLRPRSVLDIGCGTGRSLDFFLDRGVDAWGIEGSQLARTRAKHPERIVLANLGKAVDLETRYDLVWSFEVAEHIHGRYARAFVGTCTRHADTIVLSAARPGQGGEGHLNEQPPAYWIEQFRREQFELDDQETDYLRESRDEFACNLLVFRRQLNRFVPPGRPTS